MYIHKYVHIQPVPIYKYIYMYTHISVSMEIVILYISIYAYIYRHIDKHQSSCTHTHTHEPKLVVTQHPEKQSTDTPTWSSRSSSASSSAVSLLSILASFRTVWIPSSRVRQLQAFECTGPLTRLPAQMVCTGGQQKTLNQRGTCVTSFVERFAHRWLQTLGVKQKPSIDCFRPRDWSSWSYTEEWLPLEVQPSTEQPAGAARRSQTLL